MGPGGTVFKPLQPQRSSRMSGVSVNLTGKSSSEDGDLAGFPGFLARCDPEIPFRFAPKPRPGSCQRTRGTNRGT